MKLFLITVFAFITASLNAQYKTLYDFEATSVKGEIFDFSSLRGKKVLIVNTASECALAPQLKKLQELYEEYGGDNFEIIAFPCNDFGGQEPNENDKILEYYTLKYGITFPVMEKISIRHNNMHPLYQWLTSSSENGILDAKVMWNFQKFMIDENGNVTDFVSPVGGVKSNRIMDWLMESE